MVGNRTDGERSVERRLERLICAAHCQYYRPWINPEPGGECVVRPIALMRKQAAVLEAVERLRHSSAPRTLMHDNLLLSLVCEECKHHPYNCSYRRPDRSRSAPPCGGLIVLDQLIQRRVISLTDFPEAAEEPYSYFE